MSGIKKKLHGGLGNRGRVVVCGVLGWLCFLNVSVWGQFSGGGGSLADPYLISTAADMQTLSANSVHWSKHFKLTADLDLFGVAMTPIGTPGTPFSGTFDGNGQTISNLTIDLLAVDFVGLFGAVNNAFDPNTIINLGLIDPDMTGNAIVGALAGWLANGTLSGCFAEGGIVNGSTVVDGLVGGLVGWNQFGTILDSYAIVTVNGNSGVGGLVGRNGGSISNSYAAGAVSGTSNVGGLVGENNNSTISESYASGPVHGTGNNVGGLVGSNNSEINTCYATGAVTGTGSRVGGLVGTNNSEINTCYATGQVSGVDHVGGLAGYNEFNATISESYASGPVHGAGNNVGGLVGITGFNATIIKSYATGPVHGTGNNIGGLVGRHVGAIINCYAAGVIMGTVNVGGLVGENLGTVSDSFWDTESSGQASSGGGTGKTTAEMKQQATFSGWGFVSTWGIFENVSYPLLRALLLCTQDGTGYPVGDVNRDCRYNFMDFMISVQFWLEDRNW